jgi:hypothetical protein
MSDGNGRALRGEIQKVGEKTLRVAAEARTKRVQQRARRAEAAQRAKGGWWSEEKKSAAAARAAAWKKLKELEAEEARVAEAAQRSEKARREVEAQRAEATKYLLGVLATWVSPRIANEEIGDALEVIHAMVKNQRSAWAIYLKVARTIFWVCTHAVLEKVVGVVTFAMGKRDDRR